MTQHAFAESDISTLYSVKFPVPAPTIADVEQVWFTERDYLAREELAWRKSEFRPTGQIVQDGEVVTVGRIVAMAGVRRNHDVITMNLGAELRFALKGKPCRPYGSDFMIKIPATGLRTYPDLSVICGPIEDPEDNQRAAVNPTVIIEVLSKSTAKYNRGKKFKSYQQLASLREYLLVATREVCVERFYRQEDGSWACETLRCLEQTLRLDSIQVTVGMADIYDEVDFAREK